MFVEELEYEKKKKKDSIKKRIGDWSLKKKKKRKEKGKQGPGRSEVIKRRRGG